MMRQYCQFKCHSRFFSIDDERLYINWLHKSLGCHVFGINVSRVCVKKSDNLKDWPLKKIYNFGPNLIKLGENNYLMRQSFSPSFMRIGQKLWIFY